MLRQFATSRKDGVADVVRSARRIVGVAGDYVGATLGDPLVVPPFRDNRRPKIGRDRAQSVRKRGDHKGRPYKRSGRAARQPFTKRRTVIFAV
jgi:hypothetical protein